MGEVLDRAVAAVEAVEPLGKPAAIEAVVKVMASMLRDLRNRDAARDREIGNLRAAIRINAHRQVPHVTDAEINRVLKAAREG